MYRQHFGLSRLPFEPPAHSDELFLSAGAQETETRLRHLLALRGIGLLTGEPGCGKTSACRRFADQLNPGLHRVGYVSLSTGTVIDTYQSIGWSLGLEVPRYRAPAWQAIRREIARLGEAGQQPLLILDEAHNLLEELRLLTNYRMDSERRLCLLLIGQSELRRRLAMAVHERPLLEPAACEALYQASQGLPRQVGRLAHYSLAAAALAKARIATAEHVQQACREVGL